MGSTQTAARPALAHRPLPAGRCPEGKVRVRIANSTNTRAQPQLDTQVREQRGDARQANERVGPQHSQPDQDQQPASEVAVAAHDDQTADRGVDQKSEGRKGGVSGPISKSQLNDGEPEPSHDEEAKQGPSGQPIGSSRCLRRLCHRYHSGHSARESLRKRYRVAISDEHSYARPRSGDDSAWMWAGGT